MTLEMVFSILPIKQKKKIDRMIDQTIIFGIFWPFLCFFFGGYLRRREEEGGKGRERAGMSLVINKSKQKKSMVPHVTQKTQQR